MQSRYPDSGWDSQIYEEICSDIKRLTTFKFPQNPWKTFKKVPKTFKPRINAHIVSLTFMFLTDWLKSDPGLFRGGDNLLQTIGRSQSQSVSANAKIYLYLEIYDTSLSAFLGVSRGSMARSVKREAKPSPGGFAGSRRLSCFANLTKNIAHAFQQHFYHLYFDRGEALITISLILSQKRPFFISKQSNSKSCHISPTVD